VESVPRSACDATIWCPAAGTGEHAGADDGVSSCVGQVSVTVPHDQGNGKAKGR
jgi:hypothetical protein